MLHEVRLRSGVQVRGAGELNADGFTRGTIRYMPGQVIYHRLTSYDPLLTLTESVYTADFQGDRKVRFVNWKMAEKIGLQKLLIEGNTFGNMQVWDNWGDYGGSAAGAWLQNSGDWAGFYSKGFGDEAYPDEDALPHNRCDYSEYRGNMLGC